MIIQPVLFEQYFNGSFCSMLPIEIFQGALLPFPAPSKLLVPYYQANYCLSYSQSIRPSCQVPLRTKSTTSSNKLIDYWLSPQHHITYQPILYQPGLLKVSCQLDSCSLACRLVSLLAGELALLRDYLGACALASKGQGILGGESLLNEIKPSQR